MKKEDTVKNIVDVFVTLIQTIILAVIPVVLDELIKWQVVAYLAVVTMHILFLFIIRERLIKDILLATGVDISKLQKESVIEIFKEKILPNSLEIKKSIASDKVYEYYTFKKWKETSELVIVYFSSDFINKKLIKKKEVSFSNTEIYEKDIQIVVEILIDSYQSNKGFKNVVAEYKCKTLKSDIDGLYQQLMKIKAQSS